MDKWQGLQSFWGSFDLPAYDENSVPDGAVMPYITYSAAVGAFEDVVPLSASVWYRDSSWETISKKVDEISQRLDGWALVQLEDHQYIFLAKNRNSVFGQRMSDVDDMVKRVYLNLFGEYFTRY